MSDDEDIFTCQVQGKTKEEFILPVMMVNPETGEKSFQTLKFASEEDMQKFIQENSDGDLPDEGDCSCGEFEDPEGDSPFC